MDADVSTRGQGVDFGRWNCDCPHTPVALSEWAEIALIFAAVRCGAA